MRESPYLKGTREHLDRLRKLPAFAAFKEEHLKLILSLSKVQWYDPGEVVLREGEFGAWMYFVISGRVRIERKGAEITRLRGAGEVFGEMGVIDGAERSATVRAEAETTLLAVDASFLDRLEGMERAVCYSILNRLFAKILSDRLRASTKELADALRALDKHKLAQASRGKPAAVAADGGGDPDGPAGPAGPEEDA
ncbi:MAG: cyclic nucleotide-binding domain-containing protein [Thermodesulfobacteriota bacterium]